MLGQISALIDDKDYYKQKALTRALQFFTDFNYDLRNIICSSAEKILDLILELERNGGGNSKELLDSKMYLLKQVGELIDDEDCEVKMEAMQQLSAIIAKFTEEELSQSQILKSVSHIFGQSNTEVQSNEVIETLIQNSVRYLFHVSWSE